MTRRSRLPASSQPGYGAAKGREGVAGKREGIAAGRLLVSAVVPAALSIRTLGGPTLFRTVGILRLLAQLTQALLLYPVSWAETDASPWPC